MINLPARYATIVKHFTAGGMADTLLCEDNNLQRKVVVKSLKPGIAPHRLLDELSALSAIRSKYVVEVLDVIIENGEPIAFVEEYLPGEELSPCDSMTSTPLDAIKTLYPIAAGIAEVHDHKRVHRDIKPDNMRYDADGYLKIFDFGLSKQGSAPGTKHLYYSDGFTAPESFNKNTKGLHTFDYALDVYSFGCVAIWLLNDGNLFPQMSGVTPTLPVGFDFGSLPIKLDAATAALLKRCLSTNPSDRPSMAECVLHLGNEILRDKHKLALTWGTNQAIVDKTRRGITIKGNGSSISVAYTGVGYFVSAVSGNIAINNKPAAVGDLLSGSTVIVMRGIGRPLSITCDVSHPEVML